MFPLQMIDIPSCAEAQLIITVIIEKFQMPLIFFLVGWEILFMQDKLFLTTGYFLH